MIQRNEIEPYLLPEEKLPESHLEKVDRKIQLIKARRSHGNLATGVAREVLDELDEAVDFSIDGQERKARKLIRDNTLAFRGEIAPIASNFHKIVFFRDLWAVCQYVDSPKFILESLMMMAHSQNSETGQVATARSAFGKGGLVFEDETTFYLPILAYQAEVEHHIDLPPTVQEAAKKAAEYTENQVNEDGFIVNKSRRRSDWIDELILPEGDVVAFKQGLGALALRKAHQRGDIKDKFVVEQAEDGYRELPKKWDDRMSHSSLTGWRSVSALGPEAYSILWDDVKMLEDSTVENTIRSFVTYPPREWETPDLGLRVLTDQNGRYLDESYFIHPNFISRFLGISTFMDTRGNYQNGATWPREDMRAIAAAKGHNVDLGFLPDHMRGVLDPTKLIHYVFGPSQMEEFWPTSKEGKLVYTGNRIGQTWLVEILDIARRMERRFTPELVF